MNRLTGIVIQPNDAAYAQAKLNYNLAINKNPCIIVFCLHEQDVINAIRYARERNIRFRVRSGRHDFEANSNLDYGLVIDTSKINYVTINSKRQIATIGAGCTLKEMYEQLIIEGYTIPAGTCPDIGLAGISTVGGVGYASRYLGLTIDKLICATIINNKGERLIINNHTNRDLFWAIRGGTGSSFGILTSLTFVLTKVNYVSFFKASWDSRYFAELIQRFQQIAYRTDPRLTLDGVLAKKEDSSVELEISGQFFGCTRELKALIQPFLEVGEPVDLEVSYIPYEEAIETWYKDCYPPNTFKNSGSYLYKPLSNESIQTIISFVENAPPGFLHYLEFIPLGGNILRENFNCSSFAYRDARFLLQIKSIWLLDTEEEASVNWTRDFKLFLDTVGVGTYRGFTDFDIIDWQYQYFKQNYRRLQKVKTKYDPENLFQYYQAIEPLDCPFQK